MVEIIDNNILLINVEIMKNTIITNVTLMNYMKNYVIGL